MIPPWVGLPPIGMLTGPVLAQYLVTLKQCGIFEIDLVELKENNPVTLCYLYLQKSRHLLIQRQQQSTFFKKIASQF